MHVGAVLMHVGAVLMHVGAVLMHVRAVLMLARVHSPGFVRKHSSICSTCLPAYVLSTSHAHWHHSQSILGAPVQPSPAQPSPAKHTYNAALEQKHPGPEFLASQWGREQPGQPLQLTRA